MAESDLSSISTVILASGAGTRLGELTHSIPKPLLEFGGKPYLSYLLDWLIKQGIKDIVLTAHTQADQITQYIGEHPSYRDRVTVVIEPALVNTVESSRAGLSATSNATSFLLTADSIWEVSLREMFKEHQTNQAEATVLVTARPTMPNLGQVKMQEDKRIVQMWPTDESALPNNFDLTAVSTMGVYLLNVSKILGAIRERDTSIEREPMNRLIPMVFAHLCEGFFLDYGIPENYEWLSANASVLNQYF